MVDGLTANVWLVKRRKRITASEANQNAKRRATTKVCNIVKTLLYTKFRGTVATESAREQESVMRMEYVQHMRQHQCTQLMVQSGGQVIHPFHPWLAASPDGLSAITLLNIPVG